LDVFYKYSLGGGITTPSKLYARLCHAFYFSPLGTRTDGTIHFGRFYGFLGDQLSKDLLIRFSRFFGCRL